MSKSKQPSKIPKPAEIAAFRKSRKISRNTLADLCGMEYQSIANWELGRSKPAGLSLENLRRVLSGKVFHLNLTKAEEAMLDAAVLRGKFASRDEFYRAALKNLIDKLA